MSEIAALAQGQCPAIARLHLQHLPTPYSGAPGFRLLTVYYRAVAGGHGAVGYAAEMGGEVAGYVCGVWAPEQVRRAFFSSWRSLLGWGTAQVISKPALIGQVLRSAVSRDHTGPAAAVGYELRPIVVAPSWRGTGIASRLVERLFEDARCRGFSAMHLFTELDNKRARTFYEKHGFRAVSVIRRSGRDYILYQRDFSE
jgi:ribosomal protein S18 acetylase RimI-like enzyme